MRNTSREKPSVHAHKNFASSLWKNFSAKKIELGSTLFAFRLWNNDLANQDAADDALPHSWNDWKPRGKGKQLFWFIGLDNFLQKRFCKNISHGMEIEEQKNFSRKKLHAKYFAGNFLSGNQAWKPALTSMSKNFSCCHLENLFAQQIKTNVTERWISCIWLTPIIIKQLKETKETKR